MDDPVKLMIIFRTDQDLTFPGRNPSYSKISLRALTFSIIT